MKDLSNLTGEKTLTRPKTLVVPEVRLNGKTGDFILFDLPNRKDGEDVPEENLGKNIKIIMVKFRKRMQYFNKDEKTMWATNEYQTSQDEVFLFGPGEKGKASEIWEKYKNLKTQQVIYSLLSKGEGKEPILVKLIVRGSSAVTRDTTPEGCVKLFDFLSNKKEHAYEIVTEINSMEEQGQLGPYFVMNFAKLGLVKTSQEPLVEKTVEEVSAVFKALDDYYHSPIKEVEKESSPIINYDEGEVDPNEIPF